MSLIVKETSGDFKVTPAGIYKAVCFKIVDLGTQIVEFKGEKKEQRKVRIGFQLFEGVEEVRKEDEDGNLIELIEKPIDPLKNEEGEEVPFAFFQMFTFVLSDRGNFRPFLESWRGKPFTKEDLEKGFDVSKLLGVGANLKITHREADNGKTYANLGSIDMPLKKDWLKPTGDAILFDFDDNYKNYSKLSNWEKEKIEVTPEYKALQSEAVIPEGDISIDDKDDQPPF